MTSDPLVIRNNVALHLRCFMAVFLGIVAIITYSALREGPPEPEKWWPLVMLSFWACGLFGLVHSLNQEVSVIRVGVGSIQVERGKAFRREEHWLPRARLWIDDCKDSDGDPYFKLMMDAPRGKLAVKEGHHRPKLEELQAEIERAVSGR